jgi:hypothetical protein
MPAKVSAQTHDGCRTAVQTIRLDVIEERHEAEIHVQLVVAMGSRLELESAHLVSRSANSSSEAAEGPSIAPSRAGGVLDDDAHSVRAIIVIKITQREIRHSVTATQT